MSIPYYGTIMTLGKTIRNLRQAQKLIWEDLAIFDFQTVWANQRRDYSELAGKTSQSGAT